MPSAVVTGSSRGIGRAVALRFARDGYDVAVNYHTSEAAAERVAEAVRDHGVEAVTVGADVSDPDAAARLVETAVDRFGGLEHLVNNAGVDQHVYIKELSPADFGRVMDTNVDSAFAVTKAALPHLRETVAREPDPPGPSVTNVSSILAFTGAAVECHYAASKGALVSLTKSHASDFAPGIRVNAVAPGHVETDMTSDRTDQEKREELAAIPRGRYGKPEDIADAVAYLRDAGFVTGETLHVNGGELMRWAVTTERTRYSASSSRSSPSSSRSSEFAKESRSFPSPAAPNPDPGASTTPASRTSRFASAMLSVYPSGSRKA
jgi:NAD(P)-dependent dehydrogenase (short-subunit alcohol dehydrogenase family)